MAKTRHYPELSAVGMGAFPLEPSKTFTNAAGQPLFPDKLNYVQKKGAFKRFYFAGSVSL
jgi:hypothetical protein